MYKNMHEWIEKGASNDDVSKLPSVVGVDLYPKNAVLDGKGSRQQMTVRARYSDGADRDVTKLALFQTNNESSAAVTPEGLVTAGDRGEAFVMARYDAYTVGSQVIVLPKGLKFTYPSEPEANYVDGLVAAKLKKLRIAPSGVCDDEAFLRRVYLDVVGLAPTPEEYNRFMTSTDPAKRAKVIDDLLERRSSPRSGSASGRNCSRSGRRSRSATSRCSCTTTGSSRSSPRTCRWTRWSRSCWGRAAARSRTRRRTSTRRRPRPCR
jgi:hypothetical protein